METEIKMDFPEKLSFLRKQKGLTQVELAERLNVSRQAISKWEVGTAVPGIDNLKALSRLYDISIDHLLDNEAERPVQEIRNPGQLPSEPGMPSKGNSRAFLLACTAVILAAVMVAAAAILFVSDIRDENQEEIIPMEEMSTSKDRAYPTVTFSLD